MKKITAAVLAGTRIWVTPEQSKKVQELAFSLGIEAANLSHYNTDCWLVFDDIEPCFTDTIYPNDYGPMAEFTYAELFNEPITDKANV